MEEAPQRRERHWRPAFEPNTELSREVFDDTFGHTRSRAGGFPEGFLSGGDSKGSSSTTTDFGAGDFFLTTAAGGGATDFALVGPAPPALHFTVAFSYASLILAFLTSVTASTTAFNGLSPTIFINVPRQLAASFLAPSKLSSRSVARVSANGLTCGGCIGEVADANDRPRNFRVPSLTCGFLEDRAVPRSGIISARVV